MFRAWCAAEGREVLLTTRRIVRIRLTEATSEIDFLCWCGHHGRTSDPRLGRPVPEGDAAGTTPTPATAA